MGESILTGLITASLMLPAIYAGWWRAKRIERGEREQRLRLNPAYFAACPRGHGEVA
jgi:hypothetical protein